MATVNLLDQQKAMTAPKINLLCRTNLVTKINKPGLNQKIKQDRRAETILTTNLRIRTKTEVKVSLQTQQKAMAVRTINQPEINLRIAVQRTQLTIRRNLGIKQPGRRIATTRRTNRSALNQKMITRRINLLCRTKVLTSNQSLLKTTKTLEQTILKGHSRAKTISKLLILRLVRNPDPKQVVEIQNLKMLNLPTNHFDILLILLLIHAMISINTRADVGLKNIHYLKTGTRVLSSRMQMNRIEKEWKRFSNL
ncbi:hypothetical protein M3Y94_01030600 [Aphelenchoides besseyi]|nr:hypothetical protein M3Y94_01030600 [Aphelenchoides besseyi]